MEIEDERHFKSRHTKLDKHYAITINGIKVRILNYKIHSYIDSSDKHEFKAIEIITKISNKALFYRNINIKIVKDDKTIEITGVFSCALHQTGLSRYSFRINEYRELLSNS